MRLSLLWFPAAPVLLGIGDCLDVALGGSRKQNGSPRPKGRDPGRFRRALRSIALLLALLPVPIRAQTPQLKSFVCSGADVLPSDALSCTVSLTGEASAGGFVVAFISDSPTVSLPVTVTVNEGESAATFTAAIGDAGSEEQTTLSAMAGGVEQQTKIVLLSATKPFLLLSKSSGKCLDVTDISMRAGAPIQQWSCWGGENQKWSFKPHGNATYEIVSAGSELALAVAGESRRAGADVIQSSYRSSASNEKWRLQRDAAGYYNVIASNSEMCLDVRGGTSATENGVRVQQWPCRGTDNQAWTLVVGHRVNLRWRRSPTSDVRGYFLYRAPEEKGPYTRLSGRLVGTDYIDGNVITGRSYYYAVTATDERGRESKYSNRVRVVIP